MPNLKDTLNRNHSHSASVYLSEIISTNHAHDMLETFVCHTPLFKALEAQFNLNKRLSLYFQIAIKLKIYPCVFSLVQKNIEDLLPALSQEKTVSLYDLGISRETLNQVFLDAICQPHSKKYRNQFFYFMSKQLEWDFKMRCKQKVRSSQHILMSHFLQYNKNVPQGTRTFFAVGYEEGIDVSQRSDIFWIMDSGINPDDIVLFCKDFGVLGEKREAEILKITKEFGISCVCMGNTFSKKLPFWAPKHLAKVTLPQQKISSKLERWVYGIAQRLVSDVGFWDAFFRDFQVKVLFQKGERFTKTISQNIALNLNDGKTVGYQRSLQSYPFETPLGSHAKDIFFLWHPNQRNLISKFDGCPLAVVTGYPYPYRINDQQQSQAIDRRLSTFDRRRVRFVMALFDNSFGSMTNPNTPSMVSEFYFNLLAWASQDGEVGVLIKAKNTAHLSDLPVDITVLIDNLVAAQRATVLTDRNMFSYDISKQANISVGLGFSTATVEGMLAGGRAIQCDLTGQFSHPFYKWGHQKVIFDDMKQVVAALKRFKSHPENERALGDWSGYLNTFVSFNNTDGDNKIGSYVGYLQRFYEKEKRWDRAIENANKCYMDQWGSNKVMLRV